MFEWFGKVSFCTHTKVSDFARHLRDGRIMASRCKGCGLLAYPPRADCPDCLSGEFAFEEISGEGELLSHARIDAPPAGFEAEAPYNVGVVELVEAGRLLACFGASIPEAEIAVGMPVQVTPRINENTEKIQVYYSLERPGTTWAKADCS